MSTQYKRELLKIAVAQICQTIGYNATQTSSLELLQDLLQRFILEFSKNLKQQVELCNRTSPTLNDVSLTLASLNINLSELLDYVSNVEPVAFALEVPKFPVTKPTNLNFLKPGSKEVLTRPVHVFEHLPPMLPSEENTAVNSNDKSFQRNIKQDDATFRARNESDPGSSLPLASNILATLAPPSKIHDERATREISSVVMTTGGFISPAIEGKLPEAGLPAIVDKFLGLDAPPPTPPPPPPPVEPELPPAPKTPEIVETRTTLNTETKEIIKPTVTDSEKTQPLIKKNSKSFLKNDPALKHLKKIKKKNAINGSSASVNMSNLSLEEVLKMDVETLNEKARRKRFKILQKLLKNSQKQQEIEKVKGLPLPAYVAELAIGPERLLLEKLLKKQAKEKQKIPKKHKQNLTQLTKHKLTDEQQLTEIQKKIPIDQIKVEKNLDIPVPLQPFSTDVKPILHPLEPTIMTNSSLEIPNVPSAIPENLSCKPDMKLTNEPDRNKLNIFKKISKSQKMPHPQLPNQIPSIPNALPVGVFTGSEGEIINLPTGTTITPAPPIFNTPMGMEREGFLPVLPPVMENLPKKRGRKPGSKNQPKPQASQLLALGVSGLGPIGKKPKKIKIPKHLSNTPGNFGALSVDTQLKSEPLERSPTKSLISPMAASIATNLSLPNALKALQRKERKEKSEKFKFQQEAFPNVPTFPNAPLLDQTGLNIKTEPFGGVGSLHVKPIDMLRNDPEPESLLKTKPKKRSMNQNPNQKKVPSLPSSLLNTFPSPGFPGLAPNMLPLFPFPFPPTPGLIPAQGLFPPGAAGLSAFSGHHHNSGLSGSTNTNVPNPALMGLAAPFFPFAPPNTMPTQASKERARDLSLTTSNEPRNYCNVAPLVPPNLKLGGNNANSAISPKLREDSVSSLISPTNLSRKSLVVEDTQTPTKPIPSGIIGDPIEVSDDSDETSAPFDVKPTMKTPETLVKPAQKPSFPSPPLTSLPPFAGTSLKPNSSKKQKKSQKVLNAPAPSNFELDVFPVGENTSRPGFDAGFGKLAGGADLIPLSGFVSGSAYSAKSIPATSLTATARQINPTNLVNPPIFEGNKDLEQNPVAAAALFNDVTITPASTASSPIKTSLKKKSKEHKKLRKLKEGADGKIKKKKDKKDKVKEKERLGLLMSDYGQEKSIEQRKDNIKKLKKEKKKEKQRLSKEVIKANIEGNLDNKPHPEHNLDAGANFFTPLMDIVSSSTPAISNVSSSPSTIPKLTLKLGTNSQSPTPATINKVSEEEEKTKPNRKVSHENENVEREPSPELARFSPLVTRPPKQKILPQNEILSTDTPIDFNKGTDHLSSSRSQLPQQEPQKSLLPPPSPWLSGGTLTASSVLLPQQLMSAPSHTLSSPSSRSKSEFPQQHTPSKNLEETNATSTASSIVASNSGPLVSETNRPASYVDAEGNTVWICPACGKVDDGSPMIGCDGCDAWYHWECVGIAVAPNDNEDWFCRVCITRKKGFYGNNEGGEKKRKRNKKK